MVSASAIYQQLARHSFSLSKLPGNVNMITIILWFYLIFFAKHVRDEAIGSVFNISLHAPVATALKVFTPAPGLKVIFAAARSRRLVFSVWI
ncbi:MAG: hypothetical protein ACOCTS_00960 [Thermodesulfobacteriota bacterium]